MGQVSTYLKNFFPPVIGYLGTSTLRGKPHRGPKADMLKLALMKTGKRVMLRESLRNDLVRFIHKTPKKDEDYDSYRQRWMEKWIRRFPDLTPADIPYYMGKFTTSAGTYRYDVFLDGKTFGATNHKFGDSRCETIVEYAERKELPSLQLLTEFWD